MAGWSLADKVFLITGAAGGIGAAGAGELARRGATVVLADMDADGLAASAAEIGGDPLTVGLDVTDLASCEATVVAALERHGRLDAVWANAGIASVGSVELTDPLAWKRTVDVNLTGTFNTVRAGLPALLASQGYVAITASVASFTAPPIMSAYGASKAGVESFANTLRHEVAHRGVDVCTIHPSWIATRMVSDAEQETDAYNRVKEGLTYPLNKTYPLDRAVDDIVAGFAKRKRRIVSPGWVRGLVIGRALLTTRAGERDFRKAAPDAVRLYAEQVEREGAAESSASDRVREQVRGG